MIVFVCIHTYIAPLAPDNLMMESVGTFWIVLSWQQGPGNIDTLRYIVVISGDGQAMNTTVDGSETSTNITGLQPGREYMLRVIAVAVNGQRSPASTALMATTSEPVTGTYMLYSCFNASYT